MFIFHPSEKEWHEIYFMEPQQQRIVPIFHREDATEFIRLINT